MNKPPKEIDDAKVLEWAWSGRKPFGELLYESGELAAEIFGLAICQYDDSETIYRFSCDANWTTEQDAQYQSVAEAKQNLPVQYRNIEAHWQKYE
ncbi:hypothetical protein [Sessilibacter corallicola]|uniref:hypothetical protein n=1 Tax=Sessilibacter corallicola TaxID=2904075 RepID=UPI001E33A8F4|nr:hypothetical protein [Sessilibacter corallicola]MCE2029461.1 hypothetical protein [Sessilibacter corallicola]